MDVAADDSVDLRAFGHFDHGFLVAGDVLDCGLGFQFEVRCEGPVAKPQSTSSSIQVEVQIEYPVVKM